MAVEFVIAHCEYNYFTLVAPGNSAIGLEHYRIYSPLFEETLLLYLPDTHWNRNLLREQKVPLFVIRVKLIEIQICGKHIHLRSCLGECAPPLANGVTMGNPDRVVFEYRSVCNWQSKQPIH